MDILKDLSFHILKRRQKRVLNYLKAFFKKENLKRNIRSLTLLLVGTFIVSAGNAFFLIPFSIISGGVSGITILTSEFIAPDIMSYILNWALFALGLILLGFKFTISSLISTIFYTFSSTNNF